MKKIVLSLTALISCSALAAVPAALNVIPADNTNTDLVSQTTASKSNEKTDDNEETPVQEAAFVPKASIINTEAPDKASIWHMMLNSIDYYDNASGQVIYANPGDTESAMLVDFQTDISNSAAYAHIKDVRFSVNEANAIAASENMLSEDTYETTDIFNDLSQNVFYDREIYCTANSSFSVNNTYMKYSSESEPIITRDNAGEISDEERHYIDENGLPHYVYRANPTNNSYASMCIFPQEMAFGFLTDFDLWEIDGTEDYEGRNCIVISGETNTEYGKKVGVQKFIFYVDSQTGCLLKYIGYDAEGNVSDYMFSKDICFDSNAEKVQLFSENEYINYDIDV